MSSKKTAVVRNAQLSLLGFGFLIGLLFPLFYNLVLVHQSAVFFWISCLGAGVLTGWLSFMVVKMQILTHLSHLIAEIRLMEMRQQSHPLRHKFKSQDIFGQLLDSVNALLLLRKNQYGTVYQNTTHLIDERFKFNYRLQQFNDRLGRLNQKLTEMEQQVRQQQSQSQSQLETFLDMNRGLQQVASRLAEILGHGQELEQQLQQQGDCTRNLIQENRDTRNIAIGHQDRDDDKAILALSLAFANESNRSFQHQDEQLGKISTLLQEIEDTAENTHLLSINASIEAARAGEAGRSFTIVALQIRNLATKSSDLTAAIRKEIDSINALSRNSSYALGDLEELMQAKNQELSDAFNRATQLSQQAENLQSHLQPLFATVKNKLEDLSSQMVKLNQIRDLGRQNLDQQQTTFQELLQNMKKSQRGFQKLIEVGEKGLFNDNILHNLYEDVKEFETSCRFLHHEQQHEQQPPKVSNH